MLSCFAQQLKPKPRPVFGLPWSAQADAAHLTDNCVVTLSTEQSFTLSHIPESKVIEVCCNGTRLTFDERACSLFDALREAPQMTIAQICRHCEGEFQPEQVREFLKILAKYGIAVISETDDLTK